MERNLPYLLPPEPPDRITPHQYKWLMRAFTVARLTGGRRARSSWYLETFSSSSSISGWGEIDQVRTARPPPEPPLHPSPLAVLPVTLGNSTPWSLQVKPYQALKSCWLWMGWQQEGETGRRDRTGACPLGMFSPSTRWEGARVLRREWTSQQHWPGSRARHEMQGPPEASSQDRRWARVKSPSGRSRRKRLSAEETSSTCCSPSLRRTERAS